MDQKLQFVSLAATGRFTVLQLCEDFAISRKTGHKCLARYASHGAVGLKDHSRRPHGCSHRTAEDVRGALKRGRTQKIKNLGAARRREHAPM